MPCAEFRRAVVSGDGAKAAEQLAMLSVLADDTADLAEACADFLLAALQMQKLDTRKSLCTVALLAENQHMFLERFCSIILSRCFAERPTLRQ